MVAVSPPAVDLEDLTVRELRELLRERGLSTTGRKAELIERLGSD